MSGQLEINFGYFDRRGLITDAVLGRAVASDGSGVSESAMKAVLHAINDKYGNNAEAWPSQSTIGRDAGIGRRTVCRAIEALEARSILICELRKSARGTTCNHYRIVWSELSLLVSKRRSKQVAQPVPATRSAEPQDADRCATMAQRALCHDDQALCHHGTDRCATMAHELVIQPINRTTTPNPRQTESDPWAAVVDSILDLESGRRPTAWQSAIASAKASGVSPDHAAAIVRHFAATPGWDAGALVRRLQRADERIAPTDGWPAAKAPKPQLRGQDAAQQVSRIEFETIREGRRRKADERQIAAAIERRCRQADLDPAMSQFFTRIQRSSDQTPTQTEQAACPASTV